MPRILACFAVLLSFSTNVAAKFDLKNLFTAENRAFPNQPIVLIAPARPGGGWDQLARLIQHTMAAEQLCPVPFEVVNRGGAGGTIGLTELVTRHRRDPYTLMVGGSTLVGAVALHQSVFTIGDTTPLARLASEYSVIAVPSNSPLRTLPDLLEEFGADPAGFPWAGGSAGSTDHLLVGRLASAAGVDPRQINYVAYSGGGEAASAIMGSQVKAGVAGYAEWAGLAEAGSIRMLAISSPVRIPGISVPTIAEYGLDVVMENWRFIVAPPGIEAKDRDRLVAMLADMRASTSWRRVLETNSWDDRFLAGRALDEFLRQETMATSQLLADLGLGEAGAGYAAAGPYVFPVLAMVLFLATSVALAVSYLWRRSSALVAGPAAPSSWGGFAASAMLILAYIGALNVAGFLLATPLYVTIQARLMGSARLLRDLIAGTVLTVTILAVFEYLLSINLP